MEDNTCISCGKVIPEGRHICLTCERGNDVQTFDSSSVPRNLDDDFESIIICAIRYALGRRTYIVCTVCRFVLKYLGKISDKSLYVIERDIREHGHIGSDAYGDKCDFDDWMKVLDAVRNEMNRRS